MQRLSGLSRSRPALQRGMQMKKPIIVALDFDTQAKALALADALDPTECRVKVGKELFTRCGPGLVSALVQREFDVFKELVAFACECSYSASKIGKFEIAFTNRNVSCK